MTENTNKAYHQLDRETYLQTFRRYPVTLERGLGARVWDVEGKEYIDALAGIAVNNTGHCHPKVVEAIGRQAATLMHISNFYTSRPQVELGSRLTGLSGLDRVFLTNSGTESIEGALKIARKHSYGQGRGGTIVSFEGSFHGRTLAAIATGKEAMQKGFGPMPGGFMRLPFNDLEAARQTDASEVAAFLVEPVQGEGGVRPADTAFLRGLRKLCDERGCALIFDEIQTGMGRTGKLFAKEHSGVQPDIMTLAKGLGGGFPVGAILAGERVASAMEPGDHGTTFGGNPLACAAALAVLDVLESEVLVRESEEKGNWLMTQIRAWNHPGIAEVRGLGLMIGVECRFETKPLVAELLDAGVLANATAGNVLRLVPPLTISYEELETVLQALRAVLRKTEAHVA